MCIFIFRGKARDRRLNQAVTLAHPEQAISEPESQPAPHPTVDQEPESQHVPDPVAENEALAEQNSILKRKLRASVRVANGCYLALERTRQEASETGEETQVGISY